MPEIVTVRPGALTRIGRTHHEIPRPWCAPTPKYAADDARTIRESRARGRLVLAIAADAHVGTKIVTTTDDSLLRLAQRDPLRAQVG